MGRMKKVETAARLRDEQLFKLIRNYLLVYLPVQREASPHTVTNYKTVLSQYLSFAAEKNGIKLNAVSFAMFNRENVDAYLDYLTAGKKYSPATRNNRLAAIRAFVSYASACCPEYMAWESELSAIKVQRDDPFSKVDYMTENAVTALLNEPNAKTRIGLRDRTLMIFLYDSGARISEALGVRLRDIRLGSSPQVLLFGKGNKVRTVPLMEKTVEHLRQYQCVFHKEEPPILFTLTLIRSINGMQLKKQWVESIPELPMLRYALSMTTCFSRSFMGCKYYTKKFAAGFAGSEFSALFQNPLYQISM